MTLGEGLSCARTCSDRPRRGYPSGTNVLGPTSARVSVGNERARTDLGEGSCRERTCSHLPRRGLVPRTIVLGPTSARVSVENERARTTLGEGVARERTCSDHPRRGYRSGTNVLGPPSARVPGADQCARTTLGEGPRRTFSNNEAPMLGASAVAGAFVRAWPAQLVAVFGRAVAGQAAAHDGRRRLPPSRGLLSRRCPSPWPLRTQPPFQEWPSPGCAMPVVRAPASRTPCPMEALRVTDAQLICLRAWRSLDCCRDVLVSGSGCGRITSSRRTPIWTCNALFLILLVIPLPSPDGAPSSAAAAMRVSLHCWRWRWPLAAVHRYRPNQTRLRSRPQTRPPTRRRGRRR